MAYELNDNYKWWDSAIDKWRIASDTTFQVVIGKHYPSGIDKIAYFGPVPTVSGPTTDTETGVGTTEVKMTDTQIAGSLLTGIIVLEKSGSNNTFFIGKSVGVYDIADSVAITASSSKYININEYAITARSIYVKAGTASCDFILLYEVI